MDNSDNLIEVLKHENAARRKAHPNWPSNKTIIYHPRESNGRVLYEAMPLGRLSNYNGYCKYCYETHDNWWLMDQRDYDIDGLTIILCGKCEYTSAACDDLSGCSQ
jgi:hypothetical protein